MVFGTVYSAKELEFSELNSLETAFSHKLGHRIRFENKVDKNHNGSVTFGRIAQKDLLKKVLKQSHFPDPTPL